jgi:hypothetical protein
VWFRHRAWIPVAWLLSFLNVVAVWFAARALPAEPWHATIHAVLAATFCIWAQRLGHRRSVTADGDVAEAVRELEARLAELDRLPDVRGRLPELEERLDFIERALVEVRNRVPPPPQP